MKIALWAVGLAVAAFLAYGIYMAGFYPAIVPHQNGGLTFGAGTLYGRRIATESWQASYESITANSDQTVLNLEGVHDGIVDKDGKPYLNVTAQHLTVNTQTHDFVGSGNINVISLQSDTSLKSFECHDIAWSDALHRLTILGPVTLESGAAQPLVVAGLMFDVKSGDLRLGAIEGAANFRKDASVVSVETPPPAETEPPAPSSAQPLTAASGAAMQAPSERTPAFQFYFLPAASSEPAGTAAP